MILENAINIMSLVEFALAKNTLHKLDYSLKELFEANSVCFTNRFRSFSCERICEIYIIMHYPQKNITKELLNTGILFNN